MPASVSQDDGNGAHRTTTNLPTSEVKLCQLPLEETHPHDPDTQLRVVGRVDVLNGSV
jgi:hypothetical protein